MNVLISPEMQRSLQSEDYVGPATVVSSNGREALVELPDGTVLSAQPAFVIPYEPAIGDVLLVLRRREACYALGVLHGSGRVVLSLSGDVDVRAEGGKLRLWGENGIELHGPEVEVMADKVRVIAGAVTQKLTSLVQRVRDLMHVQAGEMHTIVDQTSVLKAKSAAILTEETATINGKQVQLG